MNGISTIQALSIHENKRNFEKILHSLQFMVLRSEVGFKYYAIEIFQDFFGKYGKKHTLPFLASSTPVGSYLGVRGKTNSLQSI